MEAMKTGSTIRLFLHQEELNNFAEGSFNNYFVIEVVAGLRIKARTPNTECTEQAIAPSAMRRGSHSSGVFWIRIS
jgi:hypothetical protein